MEEMILHFRQMTLVVDVPGETVTVIYKGLPRRDGPKSYTLTIDEFLQAIEQAKQAKE